MNISSPLPPHLLPSLMQFFQWASNEVWCFSIYASHLHCYHCCVWVFPPPQATLGRNSYMHLPLNNIIKGRFWTLLGVGLGSRKKKNCFLKSARQPLTGKYKLVSVCPHVHISTLGQIPGEASHNGVELGGQASISWPITSALWHTSLACFKTVPPPNICK